jgi:hypothetical protein
LHLSTNYTEAGEDIRYLTRRLTEDIGELPNEDFWLFDDDTLVLSLFSADGRTCGFAWEPAPELLRQCVTRCGSGQFVRSVRRLKAQAALTP